MSEEEWDQIGKELFKIGEQPQKNPYEQAKDARRAGKITDAHIEKSFRDGEITKEQAAELKAIKPDNATTTPKPGGRAGGVSGTSPF